MKARRLEITVSEETWAALEGARGHEPRAAFVKRALVSALEFEERLPRPASGAGKLPPSGAMWEWSEGEGVVVAHPAREAEPDPDRPRPLAPKPAASVRRAREFVLDPRQAALNKAKKP